MNISIELLLAPILTLFIVQSIKLTTDGIKGNFNLKSILTAYGGMPSSHAAVVTSLSTMIAYHEGFWSVAFAIAAIFSAIVITDAIVLRGFIQSHGEVLDHLVKKLPESEQKSLVFIPAKLRHTLPQVLVGIVIGFAIATIIKLLF